MLFKLPLYLSLSPFFAPAHSHTLQSPSLSLSLKDIFSLLCSTLHSRVTARERERRCVWVFARTSNFAHASVLAPAAVAAMISAMRKASSSFGSRFPDWILCKIFVWPIGRSDGKVSSGLFNLNLESSIYHLSPFKYFSFVKLFWNLLSWSWSF